MRVSLGWILLAGLVACGSTTERADYADGAVTLSRIEQPYLLPEGVYVYDLVVTDEGVALLADWTDAAVEPPTELGLLSLDPETGAVSEPSAAAPLAWGAGGGRLARTDGALVAIVDHPESGFSAVIATLEDGPSATLALAMDHVDAAAVSEGWLYVAGRDRIPCGSGSATCPRLRAWDLESGRSDEIATPDAGLPVALLPAEGGFELLTHQGYHRYEHGSWTSVALPEALDGLAALSDTERLLFRGDGAGGQVPVILDTDAGTWTKAAYSDGASPLVRLSAGQDGVVWTLDGWYAEDGVAPTLSAVSR